MAAFILMEFEVVPSTPPATSVESAAASDGWYWLVIIGGLQTGKNIESALEVMVDGLLMH